MPKEDVPVLIVGGGGAGLTASMLLARQGVDHLLVSAWHQLNLPQIRLEPIVKTGAERLSPPTDSLQPRAAELSDALGRILARPIAVPAGAA